VKPTFVDTSAILLLNDPINRDIIKSALGIRGTVKIPFMNHIIAPAERPVLLRCHTLADAKLLYFAPGYNLATLFLVTHAGAAGIGYQLVGEDARIMRVLALAPPPSQSPEVTWRNAVREAHLTGGTVPPYPKVSQPLGVSVQPRRDLSHTGQPTKLRA
jgi:hypothetical protein